ncbi:unnamed protein product [Symbiodinium natans]|uniref:Uncharacterized protein n=1 Tax=Symbiodinium natans TaxID=878477 RepID=A0A812JJQ6_9DINO|nr:unnamed protein product [Symbiodinium natans]
MAITADGASSMQKGLKYLQVGFKNASLLCRDPCHTIRIACGKPAKLEEEFEKWWYDIYLRPKTALVPQLQHSEKMRFELMACQLLSCIQKLILDTDGKQGAGLTKILRHLSFAAHRWESTVCPQRRYVLLQSAIALFLSVRATDKRLEAKERLLAANRLREMGPRHAAMAGVSADWGQDVGHLVKLFEKTDHDIALSRSHINDFLLRVRKLYTEGQIMVEADGHNHSYFAEAIRTCQESPPFMFGNRAHMLWHPAAMDEIKEVHSSMIRVVQAASDRLKVDFPDNGLAADFCVFDLKEWQRVRDLNSEGKVDDARSLKQKLMQRAVRLSQQYLPRRLAVGPAEEAGLGEELAAAALQILPRRCDMFMQTQACLAWSRFMQSSGETPDNRLLWGQVDVDKLEFVGPLLLWYLSVEHTSVAVEQDIGKTRALLEKHCGPLLDNGSTIDQLLNIVLDGPKNVSEVCAKVEGQLGLTEWSREWAATWLARLGRRFAVYRVRCDKGRKRGPQEGSDRSVIDKRNASVKRMLGAQPASLRERGKQTSLIGSRLAKILGTPNSDAKDKLQKFAKETARKRLAQRFQRPMALPEPRTGEVLGPGKDENFVMPSGPGGYRVVDGTETGQLPKKKDAVVSPWKKGLARDFKILRTAHYVVVDGLDKDVHMARSHLARPESAKLVLQLGMVAYGLSALSREQYAALKLSRPGGEVLQHKAAIRQTKADILMTPDFKTDCKEFAKALSILAKEDRSKWSVTLGSQKTTPQQVVLATWSDAVVFLRTIRRFDRERFIQNPFVARTSAPDSSKPLRAKLSDIFKAPEKFGRGNMGLMSKTSKRRRAT